MASLFKEIGMISRLLLHHVRGRYRVEGAIDALRRNRIVCGVRNGRIRISLASYNNSADVDAMIDVLASI